MRLAKWAIVGGGLVALGFGVSLAAQGTQPQQPDVLAALLTEVRGLRQAMEQMASAGPRVQLALGRLQLQEQRVNTMIRRLETIRDSISKQQQEGAGIQAQLANFETMFKQNDKDVPQSENNPMTAVLAGFRKAAAAGEAEIQRLQEEEAQLQQQIAAEQGRWSEINRTLEDLERVLGKR
jgi:chromosome segregation ATPase